MATDKDEKARLRKHLTTLQTCLKTTYNLANEGDTLGTECAPTWKDLMHYDQAPDGSDGAKKRTLLQKKSATCVTRIATWLTKVEKANMPAFGQKAVEAWSL
jgi:hypothetical protein